MSFEVDIKNISEDIINNIKILEINTNFTNDKHRVFIINNKLLLKYKEEDERITTLLNKMEIIIRHWNIYIVQLPKNLEALTVCSPRHDIIFMTKIPSTLKVLEICDCSNLTDISYLTELKTLKCLNCPNEFSKYNSFNYIINNLPLIEELQFDIMQFKHYFSNLPKIYLPVSLKKIITDYSDVDFFETKCKLPFGCELCIKN